MCRPGADICEIGQAVRFVGFKMLILFISYLSLCVVQELISVKSDRLSGLLALKY